LLNQIGRRRIADYHRARESAAPTTEFDPDTHEHVRVSDTFEDEYIGKVLVNEILNQLPSDLHDVAFARFVLDLSVNDTAAELDLTVDVVKKRTQLAREQLQDSVRRNGLIQ
jgi:DNA-directed RNA polymerase specialized sigma24 family protein